MTTKTPEEISLGIVTNWVYVDPDNLGVSSKHDLLIKLIATALREAQQGARPSEDEIIRAASSLGYTVEGGHHIPFVAGANWLRTRQPRAVSEMTPREQNDAFVEALKTAKMGANSATWPTVQQAMTEFKSAWENYPSQDNEGYQPDRGGFKAGWIGCYYWLKSRATSGSGE